MDFHWIIYIIFSLIAIALAVIFQRAEIKSGGHMSIIGISYITWIVIALYVNYCLIWGGFFWW